MPRHPDRLTTALGAMLVVGALLACKKRTPTDAAPSASALAAPAPVAPAAAASSAMVAPSTSAAGPAATTEVTRYAGKEKPQTGAARIVENDVKVFNEADEKTTEVATLDKDLLVFRLASVPDWELIEFPSGLGKLSPGWVQAKFIDAKQDAQVAREAVAQQPKQASVAKSTGSAAPKTSGSTATAKATPSASASAKPAASSASAATSATAVNSAQLAQAAQAASAAAARAAAAIRKATSTKPKP